MLTDHDSLIPMYHDGQPTFTIRTKQDARAWMKYLNRPIIIPCATVAPGEMVVHDPQCAGNGRHFKDCRWCRRLPELRELDVA
jgi:hypothetical protein